MTRMTRPDCAVMCNLINTHTHTHTHTRKRRQESVGSVGANRGGYLENSKEADKETQGAEGLHSD